MPTPDPDACWEWPLYGRKEDGRPQVGTARHYVYRIVYQAAGGALGPDEIAHHTCGHPWCINPFHIEPGQQADHIRGHGLTGDWGQADKTHCPAGHPYDEANTYVHKRSDGRVERHCKACRREAKRRYRDRARMAC